MARYNEILSGRFNRFMQKIFSMKGPSSLVSLSDELRPVFPFFNGVENRFLEMWDTFAMTPNSNAVAAQQGMLAMRNPVGSKVIMVIEGIYITNGNASVQNVLVETGFQNADLANINASTRSLDIRQQRLASAIVSNQTSAAPVHLTVYQAVQVPANSNFNSVILTDDQEIPLAPGTACQMVNGTANQQFQGGFRWRERVLEDSETF